MKIKRLEELIKAANKIEKDIGDLKFFLKVLLNDCIQEKEKIAEKNLEKINPPTIYYIDEKKDTALVDTNENIAEIFKKD